MLSVPPCAMYQPSSISLTSFLCRTNKRFYFDIDKISKKTIISFGKRRLAAKPTVSVILQCSTIQRHSLRHSLWGKIPDSARQPLQVTTRRHITSFVISTNRIKCLQGGKTPKPAPLVSARRSVHFCSWLCISHAVHDLLCRVIYIFLNLFLYLYFAESC